MYIYSSGSVEAQKLLFGYSVEGDVLEVSTAASLIMCLIKGNEKFAFNLIDLVPNDVSFNHCSYLTVTLTPL